MVLLKRVLYSQRKQFEVAMRTIKKDIVVLRKERKLIERQTAYLNDIQRNHL